ncbi:hypothetical protein FBZ87_11749 [Nitrospirillum amazonense]|uniref:Transcriptional initiation protein Tat n=1 Tax=Nitrospirillum amazonense TaxID=28077 RepID=A0A560J9G7_9PROT|nr:transcriptional initiation protein Tat [Nitrospirillum amazonense]TWB65954.1 hypothetical protein FBZ87_11749 [Nitrospirillum amazonense]
MPDVNRRSAFLTFGAGVGAVAALHAATVSAAPTSAPGMTHIADLTRRLAAAPRRRDFTTVPFMLDRMELWDHEASALLLDYRGGPKQVWESSDIAAAWPNLIRESLNGQQFAHGNTDFLAVSATHGTAHLALFNQSIWDKYGLAGNTGGRFARNDFIIVPPDVSPADDHQNVNGFYGPGNNSIISLQRRGVVMIACHDSIHAIARGLARQGSNADTIAADLTNNLIPGVVLVPSVVAYLVELQRSGFTYAKAA